MKSGTVCELNTVASFWIFVTLWNNVRTWRSLIDWVLRIWQWLYLKSLVVVFCVWSMFGVIVFAWLLPALYKSFVMSFENVSKGNVIIRSLRISNVTRRWGISSTDTIINSLCSTGCGMLEIISETAHQSWYELRINQAAWCLHIVTMYTYCLRDQNTSISFVDCW